MKLRKRLLGCGVVGMATIGLLTSCSGGSTAAPGGVATSGIGGAATSGSNSTVAGGAPHAYATEANPAGDIPDTQAFVAYAASNKLFTVEVPEGWARTTVGQLVLFSDKYNSIGIQTLPRASAPTAAEAQATELPGIRAAAKGFVSGSIESVHRNAGTVLLLTYRADSAPNQVTGKVAVEEVQRYEFWKDGTEVVLTLSAPAGSDNVDPWRKVTDSLSWQA